MSKKIKKQVLLCNLLICLLLAFCFVFVGCFSFTSVPTPTNPLDVTLINPNNADIFAEVAAYIEKEGTPNPANSAEFALGYFSENPYHSYRVSYNKNSDSILFDAYEGTMDSNLLTFSFSIHHSKNYANIEKFYATGKLESNILYTYTLGINSKKNADFTIAQFRSINTPPLSDYFKYNYYMQQRTKTLEKMYTDFVNIFCTKLQPHTTLQQIDFAIISYFYLPKSISVLIPSFRPVL